MDPWHTYTDIIFARGREQYCIHLITDREYDRLVLEEFKSGLAGHFNFVPEYFRTPTRPSKDEYYLGIAQAVAKRSTCIRRQYGAVIVKDDRIISTGYNGSARGEDNCSYLPEQGSNLIGCQFLLACEFFAFFLALPLSGSTLFCNGKINRLV
jgi:hypothetical protein